MTTLERGQSYPGAIPSEDTIIAEFCRHGHHLLTAMANLTPEEIRLYERPHRAGLLYQRGVILLLFEFPGAPSPWMDAPFDARVIPPEQYTPVKTGKETRMLVNRTLVDRATRLVCGLGVFTLDPGLTRRFARAVEQQQADSHYFPTELYRLYQQTTDQLVRQAEYIGRCGD